MQIRKSLLAVGTGSATRDFSEMGHDETEPEHLDIKSEYSVGYFLIAFLSKLCFLRF